MVTWLRMMLCTCTKCEHASKPCFRKSHRILQNAIFSAFEMTYIVSSGALNSTHSLTDIML